MPNQRSANKVRLGGFIDRELHREIMTLAKQEGMARDKFGFTRKLIEEALASRGRAAQARSGRAKAAGNRA